MVLNSGFAFRIVFFVRSHDGRPMLVKCSASHEKFGPNNNGEDAAHFTIRKNQSDEGFFSKKKFLNFSKI